MVAAGRPLTRTWATLPDHARRAGGALAGGGEVELLFQPAQGLASRLQFAGGDFGGPLGSEFRLTSVGGLAQGRRQRGVGMDGDARADECAEQEAKQPRVTEHGLKLSSGPGRDEPTSL